MTDDTRREGEKDAIELTPTDVPAERIWECKIGGMCDSLPYGSDYPMRRAVEEEFCSLTGSYPEFIFSGWGGKLNESERAVHEDRVPSDTAVRAERIALLRQLAAESPELFAEAGFVQRPSTIELARHVICCEHKVGSFEYYRLSDDDWCIDHATRGCAACYEHTSALLTWLYRNHPPRAVDPEIRALAQPDAEGHGV